MAARKTPRPSKAGTDLMFLSPMVMMMRLPMLYTDALSPWTSTSRDEGHRAVAEKAAAVLEGIGSAQAEMMQAWTRIWFDAMRGEAIDTKSMARSFQDITDASLEPSARRVRANYKRLSGKR